jgi:hypothetical protein
MFHNRIYCDDTAPEGSYDNELRPSVISDLDEKVLGTNIPARATPSLTIWVKVLGLSCVRHMLPLPRDNFVEVSGHNLESSQILHYCHIHSVPTRQCF